MEKEKEKGKDCFVTYLSIYAINTRTSHVTDINISLVVQLILTKWYSLEVIRRGNQLVELDSSLFIHILLQIFQKYKNSC